jgi:peptidoglycan hydrolase-like protein with peptidoglycan-binding domain
MPGGTLTNLSYHVPSKSSPRRNAKRRGLTLGLVVGVTVGSLGLSVGPAVAGPIGAAGVLTQVPTFSVGLKQGSTGPEVKSLQQSLIAAGVPVSGGADGIFGPGTRAAVVAFQSARGLSPTGEVDAATQTALTAAPAAASGTASAMAIGTQSPEVKALQEALIRFGVHLPKGANGIFDASTQRGIRNFQSWNGLPVSGVLDAATTARLAIGVATPSAPAATPTAPNPSVGLRMGAQGALVKGLQQALLNAGITLKGGADGSFGSATKAALVSYQNANGLTASGTVDDATAAKLGLGAAAAPAAAPTASANPYAGLSVGAQGDRVKDLQRALIGTGLALRGGADGSFGAATKAVLILFQKTNGSPQTGVLTAAEAVVLGLTAAGAGTPQGIANTIGYPTFGERGDRVKTMQQSLINAGIRVPGGADGVFGSGTAGAIMEYQRREGLPVTGKIDDQTAGKLGQAAAPAPAAPSASGITLTAFPVQGQCWFGDTWQAPRGGGRLHEGLDVIASEGKQIYAVVDGIISKQYFDYPGALSGNGFRISQPNGTYFTYLHMSAFADGLGVGSPVTAGQVIGYVGRTGNAATAHLHFEVHPNGGGAVNPYPLVKAVDACGNTAAR